MPIIKCKMCGGDLNLIEGSTVCECEYCGTKQTVPSADNEKKLTLFGRAGRLLRGCEFDKAAGVFETIVADFPQEAEAYWGLVLCKYGIEYVDDPATGKKIPTCHRSSFDNVMKDPNFEQACENTDAVARRVYRDEARQIEELRKSIIEVSDKEEPYDVFISYKETDANGERTPDSELAQRIYRELTREGYRVFFSRISLESHLGTEYEPYIFAALNSAKVMLVVGTDYENFDAVWVKNEWSRFLKLIAKGEKKTLIPVYKDMDAYDMPEEFSKLTALDMGRIAAMEDLIHGVEKLVGKKKAEPVQAQPVQQVVQQTVVQGGGPNVAALLKRGQQALEDCEWEKARGFYDQVLSMDAENAEAFIGLALAANRSRDLQKYIEDLCSGSANVETDTLARDEAHIEDSIARYLIPDYLDRGKLAALYSFDVGYPIKLRGENAVSQQIKARFNGDRNLNRAFRYAQGKTKQKLEAAKKSLYDTLDERIRVAEAADKNALEDAKADYAAKLEAADHKAEELSRAAQEKREADYQAAYKLQETANDINAWAVARKAFRALGSYKDATQRCENCEHKERELYEAENAAKEKAEAKLKKKNRTIGIILGSVIVAVIVISLLITKVIVPTNKYNGALMLAEQGHYEEAIAAFEALNGYKDSAEQIKTCEAGIKDREYLFAISLYEQGEYQEAIAAFEALNGYKDSVEQIETCKTAIKDHDYDYAIALYEEGQYQDAIAAFEALNGYRNSEEEIKKCLDGLYGEDYNSGLELYREGNFLNAIKAFEKSQGYLDSADMILVCSYEYAIQQYNNNEYYNAKKCFEDLGDYGDSVTYVQMCDVKIASRKGTEELISLDTNGFTNQAKEFYSSLCYEKAQEKEEDGAYDEAFSLYNASKRLDYTIRMEECNKKYKEGPIVLVASGTLKVGSSTVEKCGDDRSSGIIKVTYQKENNTVFFTLYFLESLKTYANRWMTAEYGNNNPTAWCSAWKRDGSGGYSLFEQSYSNTSDQKEYTISIDISKIEKYQNNYYFTMGLYGSGLVCFEYSDLNPKDLYGNNIW